jgi:hypothetical protein
MGIFNYCPYCYCFYIHYTAVTNIGSPAKKDRGKTGESPAQKTGKDRERPGKAGEVDSPG